MKIIKNNSGMSLIETLIASAMAIICIVAIIGSYLTVLNWAQTNKEEAVSMMHLTNIMETIKSTPFSSITADFPNGVVDGPTSPTSKRYDAIAGGYTLINEHITVSYVNPASDPLEVTAVVRWKNARGIDRARYLVTKRAK
jgi:Tfp pilus assembly protein PilV